MKVAHCFNVKNKTSQPPAVWVQRYQVATNKLIAELYKKDYEVMISDGLTKRGVPDSIIVLSTKNISACDIKDDFFLIARDIRIEHKLSFKIWDFNPGEIYTEKTQP